MEYHSIYMLGLIYDPANFIGINEPGTQFDTNIGSSITCNLLHTN